MTAVRGEISKAARNVQSACMNLTSNLKHEESNMAMEMERLGRDKQVLEDQLREKARQQQELSSQWDLERNHLNHKYAHPTRPHILELID